MWFDREVETGDDAVLESVLVDVLVDMLDVDVLEDGDVELLDLQLSREGSSDFLGRFKRGARQMRDRCRTRGREVEEKATFQAKFRLHIEQATSSGSCTVHRVTTLTVLFSK